MKALFLQNVKKYFFLTVNIMIIHDVGGQIVMYVFMIGKKIACVQFASFFT